MAIFVTDKKEKRMLESLGFEVHLESVIGEPGNESSSVPVPYVLSQILNRRKKEIERLKRECCDRCRALEKITENIYYPDHEGCFNSQVGEPDRVYYEPNEEFEIDKAIEMREQSAYTRFQGDFYRVYIPDIVTEILDSYGKAFTFDLRTMLEDAVEFQTTQVITEGLKEITIIGRIEHVTSKREMKKIDEVIESFADLYAMKYKNKFRIDYRNEKTVVGVYLMERTLDDIKMEMKLKE